MEERGRGGGEGEGNKGEGPGVGGEGYGIKVSFTKVLLVSVALPTTNIGIYTTGCFAKCFKYTCTYVHYTYAYICIITYTYVCMRIN